MPFMKAFSSYLYTFRHIKMPDSYTFRHIKPKFRCLFRELLRVFNPTTLNEGVSLFIGLNGKRPVRSRNRICVMYCHADLAFPSAADFQFADDADFPLGVMDL